MEIIYCRGGDKDAPIIANETGMRYGSRYDYTPYADVWMQDGGEVPDWPRYVEVANRWRPVMALTPDFFGGTKQMHEQVEALKPLCERIAVCPKFSGAVALIPDSCVVAISVRTSYAGFQPFPGEVVGRELHLLGGHPDQQLLLKQIYEAAGANVISVDGNMLGRKAALGQFWTANGGWQAAAKNEHSTVELAIMSGLNIREYFNLNASVKTARRVERSMYFGELLI